MNKENLQDQIHGLLQQAASFAVPIFLVVMALIYGFIIWRINVLKDAQPSTSTVAAQSKSTATPHIDQATVNQIQKLQANNESIKALFNQARNNPFSE